MDNQIRKRSPIWKASGIELGKEIIVKLTSAVPVWKGNSRFGESEMWAIEVRNQTVYEGKDQNTKIINNYSGEAVFFPSKKLAPILLNLTGGIKKDIWVSITQMGVKAENSNRLFTVYDAKEVKVQDNNQQSSAPPLTDVEKKFVDDIKNLNKIIPLTEEMVLKAAVDPQKYNINPNRAKELLPLTK